jgi:hypothetical protein
MISELDFCRAANLPIRRHGADAGLKAARLQDLMLLAGVMTSGGSYGRGSGGRSKRCGRRFNGRLN